MIHKTRIRHFSATLPESGKYLLYWMQQSQRIHFNHALAYASDNARQLDLPLLVAFVITPAFPEARFRHYHFMLQGIAEVQSELKELGIPFIIKEGDMVETVLSIAASAAWVVTDTGYLKIQRQWRSQIEKQLRCPYTEVESDIIVPVNTASDKLEYSARTLRPKLLSKADIYLHHIDSLPRAIKAFDPPPEISNSPNIATPIDPYQSAKQISPPPNEARPLPFQGGYSQARKHLEHFIHNHLATYETLSRDPVAKCQSNLSPYLHFGQISPIEVALEINQSNAPPASKEAFIEQLLVRRELAINFVHHNPGYDQYDTAVPTWAKNTLADHLKDKRSHLYTFEEFEASRTHDPYWNAAQSEMVRTGKMHNYMRMYWGKKIIEWTQTPKDAFNIMLALNNRYELDGRDPNGFTGVAWCFGRHDRAWKEREIFGKIRYMNAAGLERKFKIADYVAEYGPESRL